MTRLGMLALAAGLAAPLAAQVPALPRAGATPLRLSGEAGSFGELYRRSGSPGRRPGETGRLYLNAHAVLFGSVELGIDLLASTEDGTTLGYSGMPGRQSIQQLGLHPQWRWGRAHLGSFSESYSALTWNGLPLRGAAFDLRPGRFQFAAFRGRASGAVSGGASTGSYRRAVAGGRVGFGREVYGRPSSFVALTALRAWDDPHSLPPPDTTLPPGAPVAGGVVPVNPFAVTPEENVVLSGTGGLSLLGGKLAWRAELAGAIHSRDRRAAELDSAVADVPGVLRGLITPRVGTHADYAMSSELQLRQVSLPGSSGRAPRTMTASLAYRYVGPGYVSLGAASLGADLEALDGRASLRFPRWTASLQAGRQHDNLADQKLSTTARWRLGTTVALRVSRAWNATLRAGLLTMGNGRADSLQWMDYHSHNLGMGHAFAFGPRRRFESLTLDAGYTVAGDDNPLRHTSTFSSLTASARLAIRLTPAMQISPTLGLSRSRSDTLTALTRATYGVYAAWRLWDGRLATVGSVGRSTFSRSNGWVVTLGSTFRLTDRDDLVLNLQYNRYRDLAGPGNAFDEQIVNLRWARRF